MTTAAAVNDVSELSAEQLASILRFHTREGQVFDHSNDTVVVTRTLLNKSADLIEQQQREIERLREALMPFAKASELFDGEIDEGILVFDDEDEQIKDYLSGVTIGDLRKASAT